MDNQKTNKRLAGFSLIEMAVVIAIMGILMTFGIRLATSFQNKGAFSATTERQNQIKDVLTAYLATNGRLPCPSDPSVMTGNEDCAITNNPGLVPFQTLGIPKSAAVDGWDRYFTYVVWNDADTSVCSSGGGFDEVDLPENWTININHSISPSLKTYHDGTNGCLMITEADAAGNPTNLRRAVALVISHGPNGYGGYTSNGGQINLPADALNEDKNSIVSGGIATSFWTQPINLDGFDDIVMEISANDLLVPLRRNGTIVNKQQLGRDYLYTLFSITPDVGAPPNCNLNYVAQAVANPASGSAINVTLSHTDPQYTASITVSANQYCPAGLFTNINLVPSL